MTEEQFQRAMLVATGASISVAIVGALIIFFVWYRLARRGQWLLLLGLACTFALAGTYFVSAVVLMRVAHLQLAPPAMPGEIHLGDGFIHPGALQKLAPLVAIVTSWVVARRFSRCRDR